MSTPLCSVTNLNQAGTIERSIALTDIYATLNRYAATARDGVDWTVKGEAFQPDGRLLLPNGVNLPVSRLSELVQGKEAAYYRHHVTAMDVHFIDVNRATATSQVLVVTNSSTCDHWGEWRDILVRTEDGRWLIEEKTIVVDGYDPKGWYAANFS